MMDEAAHAGPAPRAPATVQAAAPRAYALAAMFAAGAIVGLASFPVAVARGSENETLALICILALPLSAAIMRFGPTWPAWTFHPLLATGTVIMFASVWFAGSGNAAIVYGMLATWVALYAGYFFSPFAASLHGATAVGGYAALLVGQGQPAAFEVIWLAGSTFVIGSVSHWLAHGRTPTGLDPLTSLPNRRGLTDVLATAMRIADTEQRPLTVALIDLDHFHHLNATHGYDAGDRILVNVARSWQRSLPPDCTLARYGGDEFVIVMLGMPLADACAEVETLRTTVPGDLTCSAGVAPWLPGDSLSLLLTRADTALYEAKQLGRNRTASVGDDHDLISELWSALGADEFVVHYQPVIDLSDDRLLGFEALVRWDHPERGRVGPNTFIPAAEASGAIHDLGSWVLGQACGQLAAWRAAAPALDLTMAINLSPIQLEHPGLVEDIEAALRRSQLPGSALVLEVTEGAIHGEMAESAAVLWQLRDLGVRLAIDDFGTGHSSLSRLRSLPFNVLKIDRSFVRALDGDHGGGSLLAAIVGMANSLGLQTIAEGVEEIEDLRRVREHGCGQAQGYVFGYPSSADRLSELIRTGSAAPLEHVDAASADVGCLPVPIRSSRSQGSAGSTVLP